MDSAARGTTAGNAPVTSPGRTRDLSVIAPAVAGAMFAAVDGWQLRRGIDRDELVDRLLALLQGGLATGPEPM